MRQEERLIIKVVAPNQWGQTVDYDVIGTLYPGTGRYHTVVTKDGHTLYLPVELTIIRKIPVPADQEEDKPGYQD